MSTRPLNRFTRMDFNEEIVTLIASEAVVVSGNLNGLAIPFVGAVITLEHFDKILGVIERHYIIAENDLRLFVNQMVACLDIIDRHHEQRQ